MHQVNFLLYSDTIPLTSSVRHILVTTFHLFITIFGFRMKHHGQDCLWTGRYPLMKRQRKTAPGNSSLVNLI